MASELQTLMLRWLCLIVPKQNCDVSHLLLLYDVFAVD